MSDDRDIWHEIYREQRRSHAAYQLALMARQKAELDAQWQTLVTDNTDRVLGWWRAKNAPTTHTEPAGGAKGGERRRGRVNGRRRIAVTL